jgi:transposase InsO family protein
VQIDSTPIDVLVLLDNGVPVRADLTIAVDIATRTICAAVLRPVGTKAVDAALLLARMLVPEPMRPGWSTALRMSTSRLPHSRLVDIDARMELAAARPVIVPDTIVIDGGKVFISDTFTRACDRLGVSVQRARPRTPTDKAIVEATFGSITRCSVSMSPPIPARTRRCAASTRPARGRCRSCRTCLMSGCWPGGSRAHTMGCATRCCRGGRCRRTRCTPRWSPLRAICR